MPFRLAKALKLSAASSTWYSIFKILTNIPNSFMAEIHVLLMIYFVLNFVKTGKSRFVYLDAGVLLYIQKKDHSITP